MHSHWFKSFMLTELLEKIKGSVRGKLLVLVLFPILLVMPIALVLAGVWGTKFTYDQLFIKVNTDLSVVHDVFGRIRQDKLQALVSLSNDYRFRAALEQGDASAVQGILEQTKSLQSFNYLHLTDLEGNWQAEPRKGKSRPSPMLKTAGKGEAVVDVEIFSLPELVLEDPEFSQQNQLVLLETPRARATDRMVEDRAMVVRAVAPLRDNRGQVVGFLDGGLVLNRNFQFVDALRDLVYGQGNLAKGSIGTVTVFLDDVRISTNVPLRPGERALGTRVSNEVRTKVLDQGEVWIDRAFVVNDWYISSYEPIVDNAGKRVGILYAGFLEKPYSQTLRRALWVLVLLFVGLMLLSAILAIKGAESIFRPLEAMSSVVRATRSGKAMQHIGKIHSRDEIGELAREFDAMMDLLQERQQQLQHWADHLEVKVDERTAELQRKNDDLERTIRALRQTRKQLVEAEKLAALGELTAGVAHEINNPAQVILGNMGLLTATLGERVSDVKEEVDLVIEQVFRIQEIINHLLQYARPGEFSEALQETDVNDVIRHSMNLIHHLRMDIDVDFRLDLQATQSIEIQPWELEQVLVNLTTNGIHALDKKGGEIHISSRNWDEKGVVISVRDTGCGISEAQMENIFNPFFSSKKQGEGTGLGLSVSYGLIRRYGGNITVRSELDVGTEFFVWVLTKPQLIDDEKTIVEQLQAIEQGAIKG